MSPPPRSFHDRAWQEKTSDARIRRVIVFGGASVGLNPAMAANPDLEDRLPVVDALLERIRGIPGASDER